MRPKAMSDDYEPCLELRDGEVTDMLIEDLLSCIYGEVYDATHFDEVYTKVVRSHIHENCPELMAGHAGRDRINTGAVHYLVMLQLDFTVITAESPQWPGFDFMPDATTAVAVHYPDGETLANYAPGKNINQAALASIIQMAREISLAHYNEPELPLRPTYSS